MTDERNPRFRSHLSRWHALRRLVAVAFSLAVALFNATLLVEGVATGEIDGFSRRAGAVVSKEADPTGFALVAGGRALFVLLFAAATWILWRQWRRERRRGIADD